MTYLITPLADKPVRRDLTTLHFVIAISLLAIGIVSLGFAWFAIIKKEEVPQELIPGFSTMGWISMTAGMVIILLTVMRKRWLRQQRNSASLHSVEVTMLAVIAAFFAWKQLMIPASIFAFMTLASAASILWRRRQRIGPVDTRITEDGVHLSGGKNNKTLKWWQIEKVMLRHGVLTIEVVENRVYQRHVQPVHFDLEEFEHFCTAHIMASEAKRKAGIW